MSVRGQFTVFCNGPHCLVWIGQEDTPEEARTIARNAGWKTGRGKNADDLCAAHKPAGVPACGQDGARLVADGPYWQCAWSRDHLFSSLENRGVVTPPGDCDLENRGLR
jgi:hypothetical protein